MLALLIIFALLSTLTPAFPTQLINTPHPSTTSSSPRHNPILPRTPSDPIFVISNYTHHVSPLLFSVTFHFHDPRPQHSFSVDCSLLSPSSIYLDAFTTCGESDGPQGRKGSLGFRVSEGEVVVRRGWWDGDYYFVGYAPQATNWKDTGLAANASLMLDGGVTYTRTADWAFPVKSMTVSGGVHDSI